MATHRQPTHQQPTSSQMTESKMADSKITEPLLNTPSFWQKPKANIGVALLGLIIALILVNMNINKYETHLATGETVLLELAPVDPRGFMQGDYMALRFAIADDIREQLDIINKDTWSAQNGYAIIKKDEHNVGQLLRVVTGTNANNFDRGALQADEMALFFRLRQGEIKFATNAFFFQEGHAEAYEAAEYGLFRVNEAGEPLLTNMVDEKFAVIEGMAGVDD